MKTIVITGSTRGVGLGLARELAARGSNVVICGRSQQSVDKALAQLDPYTTQGRVSGQPCDVAEEAQVQALWDMARERYGRVDIWINNAALNADHRPVWEFDGPTLRAILDANIAGTLIGSNVALRGMVVQGGGHLYNVKGLGSGGEVMRGTVPYGIGKSSAWYITKALRKEARHLPITISTYSPGIVATELLRNSIDPANAARNRALLNILADTVETVTPWLAEQILRNDRQRDMEWMTMPKMIGRFLRAPFQRRDLFAEAGWDVAPQP